MHDFFWKMWVIVKKNQPDQCKGTPKKSKTKMEYTLTNTNEEGWSVPFFHIFVPELHKNILVHMEWR